MPRLIALSLAATIAGTALNSALLAAPFDGSWSFDVSTDVGDCEAVRNYPVAVSAGRMAPGVNATTATVGTIESNGSLWGRFSTSEDVVRLQGRLTKAAGSGTWSSGSRYCGGKWRAHKG